MVEFNRLKAKVEDAEPNLINFIIKGVEKGKEKIKELSGDLME